MGWGRGLASEAVLEPMADRDWGCWKPEKPDVVVTQELRERLSEAVKAEPVGQRSTTVYYYHFNSKLLIGSFFCEICFVVPES